MFDYISGKLVSKLPTAAVIDVHGLGFSLTVPASSFDALPEVGENAMLFVYNHVREDAFVLFGFASHAERVIFEHMIAVSGVGPKLALAALSSMGAEELRTVIIDGDVHRLTRIPGVGRKTAERLALELRDRFSGLDVGDATEIRRGTPEGDAASAREDALRALESLGLARSAAEKSLRRAMTRHPTAQTAEELVRLALQET